MKVQITQRKPTEIITRKILLDDNLQDLDFYEKAALKLGWKKDIDALWYLSTKGIIKIEKLDSNDIDYNYYEPKKTHSKIDPNQQTFSFDKPIIMCIERINN